MKIKNLSANNIRETLIKIYFVQFFSLVAASLSTFVNGIITGNFLTAEEMVALGLTTPLVVIISAISATISGGASIVCGRLMGKGEGEKNHGIFACTINVLLIIGVILTAAFLFFSTAISKLLTSEPTTIFYTSEYIRGIAYGIIPTLLMPCLVTFLQMANKSIFSLVSTLCLAFFATAFGLANVKIFNLGIYGMGVSTSLSQFVTVLIVIAYLFIKKNVIHYDVSGFTRENIASIILLGIPSSVAGILYSIRNIAINKTALEVGGLVAANALTIMGSICGFIDAFCIALATSITMIVSVFVGEKDAKSIIVLFKQGAIVGLIGTVFKHSILIIFGYQIAKYFGATSEVCVVTRDLLIMYGFSAYLNVFNVMANNTYACQGRTKLCLVQLLVTCLGIPFVCLFLSHSLGYEIIWHLYYLAEIASLIIFYGACCIVNKGIVKTLDQYLYLDKGFEFDAKISISINTIEQVTDIAEKLQHFCLDNNIDSRRSMLVGLCVEEMAGNIVDHGFEKDNKENTIDIFASIDKGEVSVRLRDNCVPFDPNSKLGIDENDPIKNVGIKMVKKLAKEMNYQITFGMNILTIKI